MAPKHRGVCLAILLDYIENSSIHGLRFITENGRFIIERLFWLVAVACSCYGTYRLTKSSYLAYKNNPISFATETDYLHWNTSFPAVSVCEKDGDSDAVVDYLEKKKSPYKDDWNFIDLIESISYPGKTCYACNEEGCKTYPEICEQDISEIVLETRASCPDLFRECRWNGVLFDCCSAFRPLDTERGRCYTANSAFHPPAELQMISNRHTGPGKLEFSTKKRGMVYIHDKYGVPYHNHITSHILKLENKRGGNTCEMRLTVMDIVNDPLLREENLERRGCRFPEESPLRLFKFFSYSACIVDCRATHQLEACGCMHHFLPNVGNQSCKLRSIGCLDKRKDFLGFRTPDNEEKKATGIVCNCSSSCVEAEYNAVYQKCYGTTLPRGVQGKAVIKLVSLPTERYRRNLIRTRLDLVVSVGGTFGLFLGASLLSFVEVFIYFCVRPLSNKYPKEPPAPEKLAPY